MSSFRFSEPWVDISEYSDAHGKALMEELSTELSSQHCLFNKHLSVIAKREDCDKVLLTDKSKFYVVHLTWSGKQESTPYPNTVVLNSTNSVQDLLNEDARYY